MSVKRKVTKAKRTRADSALARQMLRQLKDSRDVRARKVRRIGAAIRADRYENALKWNVALDRMIEDAAAR